MTPRMTAIDLHNRALPLIQTDPRLAYQMLTSAVMVDPTFSLGWNLLGVTLADTEALPASIAAYRRALALPDGPNPHDMNPATRFRALLQIGHRLTNNLVVSWETLDEAERFIDQALAMEGDFDTQTRAFCHTNMSLIHAHRGHKDKEMASATKGFELHQDPQTEMGLAFACLYAGEFMRGLKHFDARFPYKLTSYQHLPWPRWDGGHVDKLFVLSEQGLGDALSFSRFIPAAAHRVGEIEFPVQPELVKLLTGALKKHKNVRIVPQSGIIEHADAWCPIFSLPLALDMTDREFEDSPNLPFEITPVEDLSWKRRDARLNIAIAWAGAPSNGIDVHRTIKFVEFLALCRIPNAAIYSVQVGSSAKELHEKGGTALVKDLAPWIHDARDTAGILAEMDVVVTAESFVGHLAGAIGKRCILLCSRFGRDWRSGPYRDTALWYPKHEIYRQGDDAKWGPVFDRVVGELSK